MDNYLYIPEGNPVIFYDAARSADPVFFTKHFEDWMFEERLLDWQNREEFCQIWQTTDIIRLQFEATFSPIIVSLFKSTGENVFDLPALIGMPNVYIAGTYSFEVQMSLAGLETGCYRLQITAGSGINQKILISDCQYISAEQIENSLLFEYFDTKQFSNDFLWATGFKPQYRVHGHFGFLDKARADTFYRNQRYDPTLLQSKSAKQWPLFVGNEFGLPDDHYNIIDNIWKCDTVRIDNKLFGLADGSKVEVIAIDEGYYPKRGFKYTVEAGINRSSRIFTIDTDTTKKLASQVMVEASVFGDTSNQGSANTVPVFNVQQI